MLIKVLKKNNTSNLIIFISILIVLWIKPFFTNSMPGIYIDPDPTLVYQFVTSLLATPGFEFIGKILAFFIILTQTLVFNGILNQYNMLGFRSYLPGIVYIFLISIFSEFQLIHPLLLANTFLLFAWQKTIEITEFDKPKEMFFNAAFLIGLSTFFYPNYIYFLPLLVMSISMNRIGQIREFFMIIVGFLLVWYFYLSLVYLTSGKVYISGIALDYSFDFPKLKQLFLTQKLFIVYLGILVIMASLQLGTYISNLKIIMRRNLKFMFLWFLLSLSLILFTHSSIEIIYLISIPLSILFSLFFVNLKLKWTNEALWIIFILLALVIQFYPDIIEISAF